ncbi:hypothetical protein OSB04_030193 [Centaurea solstitialis]|uniref:F-box domain-containing protein n=1 Tax=Centaurea solstitialis TaxID=347529 RepID=A0AA38SJR5_9ASTR|nr:hypothetical protein OSB04_030193 [Centaurea solstitialis]
MCSLSTEMCNCDTSTSQSLFFRIKLISQPVHRPVSFMRVIMHLERRLFTCECKIKIKNTQSEFNILTPFREKERDRMDSLPDDVVQHILSKLSNANDVASCNSVSNRWRKHLMSYRKSLCFSHGIFENLKPPQTPDPIMMQMVSSVSQLEQLVVSCRFTLEGLTSWLPVAGSSLKSLELRVAHPPTKVRRILECINQATARNLEYIKLWHVMMTRIPKLDVFHKLRCLEICEVIMEDSVLMEALRATPHLTRLVLLDCKGLSSVQIELPELRHCQLETCYTSGCSITLRAPKLQHLKVRGLAWIRVDDTNCLKTFSIVNYSCTAPMVELGDNLMALESLSANGYQWRWEDVTRMLQHATEVKHLSLDMRLIPESTPIFPEIDFLDLFKTRPKLEFLHIHDVMIDALCNNHMTTTLKNRLVIPCLEEVVIILALPSNVGKVTWVVKSLLKYGTKLKKIKMIVNDFLTENHCLDRFCNEIPRKLISHSSRGYVGCDSRRTDHGEIGLLTFLPHSTKPELPYQLYSQALAKPEIEGPLLPSPQSPSCHIRGRVRVRERNGLLRLRIPSLRFEPVGVNPIGEYHSPDEPTCPRMDLDPLPNDVVQHILSKLSNAKDVASCNCVFKRWKDLMSYRNSLCFPCDIFDNLTGPQTPDSIVIQMVSSVSRLEHLVVSCPLTIEGQSSVVGSSLKSLELRVAHAPTKVRMILECINQATARNLEYLKLWRVMMTRVPKLDVFHKLHCFKICEVIMEDSVLMEALRATPHLTRLELIGCKGLSSVQIELPKLRNCLLETCHTSDCSITFRAPKLQHLKVKGWAWIRVHDTNCLKTFSIVNNSSTAPMVELGDNLMELESLFVKAYEWHWEAMTRNASACNRSETSVRLVIPCLEEVVIALALPSNVGKVTWVVKSLLKYGNKLKKIKMIVNDFLTPNHCLDRFCDEIPSMADLRPVLKNYPPPSAELAFHFATQRDLMKRVMDYRHTYDEYPTIDPQVWTAFADGGTVEHMSMRARLRNLLDEYFDIYDRVQNGERIELSQVQMEIYDMVVKVRMDEEEGLVLDYNLDTSMEAEPSPDYEKSDIYRNGTVAHATVSNKLGPPLAGRDTPHGGLQVGSVRFVNLTALVYGSCHRSRLLAAGAGGLRLNRMDLDLLPDDVVQHILSKLSNAKDVASCNCVSKKWKDLMNYRNSLCFPDGIFNNLTGPQTPESIVIQMVSSVSRLEHLVISCPLTIEGQSSVVGSSLKNLELRVDHRPSKARTILECINQAARNLEYLKLWRVAMTRTPKLDVFQKLRNLKIYQAIMDDTVFTEALRATPHLTRLRSDRASRACYCQLHTSHTVDCSITLRTPKLQHLKLKGWARIRVHDTNRLKTFSIKDDSSCVAPMVELGHNLMALESLSITGYEWHWEVMKKMLQLATKMKHLYLETGFTIEGLASWLLVVGYSLKKLELRVAHAPTKVGMILECINQATARNLEYLKLWRVMMTRTPKFGVFHKLRDLSISEVVMEDSVLMEALRATPHLTRLELVGCKGLSSIQIELLELRHCQLHTCHTAGCSVTLRTPKLQYLELSGWAWIRVYDTNCLKTFSVNESSCVAPMVELGDNLMALESLSVEAYECHWEVITKMLRQATQVKHLSLDMGITPGSFFPETDNFLDLLKTHPKLEFLRIVDGTIDALCKNHIKNVVGIVDSSFVIPCLEEVISVASRSNGEKPVLRTNSPGPELAFRFERQRDLMKSVMDYRHTNGEYPTTDPEVLFAFADGNHMSIRGRLRNLLDEYFDIYHRVQDGERVELFEVQMEIYDWVVEVKKDAEEGLVLDNNLDSSRKQNLCKRVPIRRKRTLTMRQRRMRTRRMSRCRIGGWSLGFGVLQNGIRADTCTIGMVGQTSSGMMSPRGGMLGNIRRIPHPRGQREKILGKPDENVKSSKWESL